MAGLAALSKLLNPSKVAKQEARLAQRAKDFAGTASAQRGSPELAMDQHWRVAGSSMQHNLMEHVGDLTHRMAERDAAYSYEFVAPKVRRALNDLRSYNPYKEYREWVDRSYKYAQTPEGKKYYPMVTEKFKNKAEFESHMRKLELNYAKEHKKVPVYNRAQWAGREAAIAIGKRDYRKAQKMLQMIQKMIDSGEYNRISKSYDPEFNLRHPPK